MARRSVLLAVVVAATLAACSNDQPPQPAFEQVYTVRGIISELPTPDRPNLDLQIHHEAIPEFVNGAGEQVGMNAMTMPFPTLAQGVTLDGLEEGDKIRFTFGVVWEQGTAGRRFPHWTVTAIEELPAETELTFSSPPEPQPQPDSP
ncbi:MAG: copper-binding protein [Phycisphaerales bacterium]